MANTPVFEHKSCSRCGGCGHFSFNQIDGTICFGCRGSGFQLTKRGHVASNFYKTLVSVPAGSLKLGDSFFWRGLGKGRFTAIVEITTDSTNHLCLTGLINGERHTLVTLPDYLVVKGHTKEQKQAFIQQALDFQASLTQAGTPRKRKA